MDDEDGKQLAEILRVLHEADEWAKRTGAAEVRVRPLPRSSLRGDDIRAFQYAVSHAVWRLLSNAVDHLTCLRALLEDAKVIPMYAAFTLVRGAVENACGAVWLLQPPQRKERLTRQFRWAIADIRHEDHARRLMGQEGARTEQERIAEVPPPPARALTATP